MDMGGTGKKWQHFGNTSLKTPFSESG